MLAIIQYNQYLLNDRNTRDSIISTMNGINVHGLPAPAILFLVKGSDSGQ